MKHRTAVLMVAVVTLFCLAGGLALAQDDPPRRRREQVEREIPDVMLGRLLASGAVDVEVVRTDDGVKLTLTSERPEVVEALQDHARRWRRARRERRPEAEEAERLERGRRWREERGEDRPEGIEERLRERRRQMLREQRPEGEGRERPRRWREERGERRPEEGREELLRDRRRQMLRERLEEAPRDDDLRQQMRRRLLQRYLQRRRGADQQAPRMMPGQRGRGRRPMLRDRRPRPRAEGALPRYERRPGMRGGGAWQRQGQRFAPQWPGAGRWGEPQGRWMHPGRRGRGFAPQGMPFQGRGRFGPHPWADTGMRPGYGECPGYEECPYYELPRGPHHRGRRGR